MTVLTPRRWRALTAFAAIVLGFDGAALLLGGLWTRQPVLVAIGGVLMLSVGLVVAYGRRHERRLEEIAEERQRLRDEVRGIQDLLSRR